MGRERDGNGEWKGHTCRRRSSHWDPYNSCTVNERIRGSTNCTSCLKLATDDDDRVQETSRRECVSTSGRKRKSRAVPRQNWSVGIAVAANCSPRTRLTTSPGIVTPRRNGDYRVAARRRAAPRRITRDDPGITPVIHIKHPNKSITRRVYRDASPALGDRREITPTRREAGLSRRKIIGNNRVRVLEPKVKY